MKQYPTRKTPPSARGLPKTCKSLPLLQEGVALTYVLTKPSRCASSIAPARDMNQPDFIQLVQAARLGDGTARDQLVRRYLSPVRKRVHAALNVELRSKRRWLVPLFSTGDIVQEVLIAVLRDLSDFEGLDERSFVSYLAALIRNRLTDTIRFYEALRRDARRGSPISSDDDLAQPDPNPAERAELAEAIEAFTKIVASFPAREALLLRERLERRTEFAELAEQLGYGTPDTARKAYYVAQARLITRMRAAGIAPEED